MNVLLELPPDVLPYTGASGVFVGHLFIYPEAVARGIQHELERLDRANVPAFAERRLVFTPHGSFFITLSGKPSRLMKAMEDFETHAYFAALSMESDDRFSFNRTFFTLFLQKEEPYA